MPSLRRIVCWIVDRFIEIAFYIIVFKQLSDNGSLLNIKHVSIRYQHIEEV